jgi:hypothetical protein
MLLGLLRNEVRFLIVGAYAMAAYGYPRATGDIDIWIGNTEENSDKLYKALSDFGAPLDNITPKTFSQKDIVFQIGVAPSRIDILTDIDGINFTEAYESKQDIKLDGLILPFISKSNLIKNKKSTGRDRDIIDAQVLEDIE